MSNESNIFSKPLFWNSVFENVFRNIFAMNGLAYSAYSVLGFEPGLVLDFGDEYYRANGASQTFSNAITHTRAGNATMVDSDGVLKWAPHNLALYSNDFSNAAWAKSACAVTQDVTGPDGETSGWTHTATSTSCRSEQSFTVATSTSYVYSVYAKAGTTDFLYIAPVLFTTPSNASGVCFNLSNGTVGIQQNAAQVTGLIEDAGGGWYRCVIHILSTDVTDTTGVVRNTIVSANGATTCLVGNSLALYGAHLYRSDLGGMTDVPSDARAFPSASTYVPTTSAARYLPRRGHHIYNGAEWVNEGVLVESEPRVNFAEHSRSLIDAYWGNTGGAISAGISQDNPTQDPVSSFSVNALGDNIRMYSSSRTPSVVSTFSFLAKANGINWVKSRLSQTGTFAGAYFDLSTGSDGTVGSGITATIEDWGDGWYLCSTTRASATNQAAGLSLAEADGDVNLTGYSGSTSDGVLLTAFQWEDGPTRSSYIPTLGSTVTRAADVLTIPAANLPWPTPRVIGPELVDDGGFDVGTVPAGWEGYAAATASSTLSVVSNALRVTRTGSAAGYCQYTLTGLTIGKVYLFSAEFLTAANALFSGSTASGDTSPDFGESSYSINAGIRQFAWTATATTAYIIVATTAASVDVDNISVREINPLSVSIQMDGTVTGDTYTPTRWYLDANNAILQDIGSTDFTFTQEAAGVVDTVTGGSFTSGVNTPFNIASRHGSTFINGAVDGTALTADTTPVALPDLSATDLQLGYDYMGTVKLLRMWNQDLGDAGIAEAST